MRLTAIVRGGALGCVLAFVISGCGGDGAPRTHAADRLAIEQTALTFASDVFAGKWDEASELVADSDQDTIKNLAEGADPTTLTTTTGLRIGDIKIRGLAATAVLLGKACHLRTGFEPQCIDNTDPASTDPTFVFSLVRQGDTWKIVFPGLNPVFAAPDRPS